ncbi:AAA family ATPase [Pseudomonas sp. Marseille-P9899]|uniref:AAA family ATPase n=1 Tax=Pseudomonas sp. Marseille-P9899 TaxID=2730401 RepID=UPI00158E4685|nr:AAA family ATPase [Pseudomonas sp. Marseille-P9899]
MQHIPRDVPPPAILTGSAAKLHRESAAHFMMGSSEQLSQQTISPSALNLGHSSMRQALEKLFRGRCAFCEARTRTQPYRFRPLEQAQPYQASEHAHLYYSWLDIAWENLYPICKSCLPKEANYFPVIGKRAPLPTLEQYTRYAQENTALWPDYPLKERPVLLDPCIDHNFHKHIDVQSDGNLVGISEHGVLTIRHFQLNAPERVSGRLNRYQRYYRILLKWVGYPGSKTAVPIFNFSELEFGGTWYLLLRRLAASVGAKRSLRPVLSKTRIDQIFIQLRQTRDARQHLESCWQQITMEHLTEFSNSRTGARRPSDANIREIHIKNFKAIEQLEIRLPTPIVTPVSEDENGNNTNQRTPSLLIIGENAAGKSSILEAVALGLSSTSAIKGLGLTARNFILDPRFMGGEASAKSSGARVEIRLSNEARCILHIDPGRIHVPDEHIQESIPVFAYGAFRQYQHKLKRKPSPDAYIRNLFDGSVLPNPEQWLLDLRPDRFAMVVRALRHILSIDGGFEVIRRDTDNRQCFVVTAMTEKGAVLSQSTLNVASSGFRSVLAMACDVMRGMMDRKVYPNFESLETARGVVLIDEVEAHLHPRWKMRIMHGLRLALPNVTFIATTHDPLCLRGMNDGEIVVLRRVKAGSEISSLPARVESQIDLPPVSGLRLEQLLTSDLFQLHSTD